MNFKIKTTAFRGLCLKIALFITKNAVIWLNKKSRLISSEARKKASRNSYIKWPSGVFPKYEIAVISRAKSAVHKDIKVKNDEVRAKREPSLLQ